jgi:methionine biosynthesis protein MetW
MKKEYEQSYHRVEDSHWWFAGRRDMIMRLLRVFSKQSAILEVGCSSGPLQQLLQNAGYTHVQGIELSEQGVAACHARGFTSVQQMDAAHTTFANEQFDCIVSSDVLEHIEQEAVALQEWNRILKPGGTLVIFVPAYMLLWSHHDTVNLHHRRYTRASLVKSLTQAGFTIQKASYWNTTLLVPVAIVRLLQRVLPQKTVSEHGEMKPTATWINTCLLTLFTWENRLLQIMNFPAGVSVFAIAKKGRKN